MESEPINYPPNNATMSYEYKDFVILLLIVVLVLSVLGINIFLLLGALVQYIVYLLQPLFSLFGYASGNIINTSADLAANVSHFGIEIADGTAHDVGNLLLGTVDEKHIPTLPPAAKSYSSAVFGAIEKALSLHPTPQAMTPPTVIYVPTPAPAIVIHDKVSTPTYLPAPTPTVNATPAVNRPPSYGDDTTANPVQNPISSGKSQWCLVGEYENRRGCVEVEDANKCMSGQLFPTQQMCLNPTLTTNAPR